MKRIFTCILIVTALFLPATICSDSKLAAFANDRDATEAMILPAVRIFNSGGASGSGFLIEHKAKFFVVTAKHVVMDEEAFKEEKALNNNLKREEFADKSNISVEIVCGSIRQMVKTSAVFCDEKTDTALLSMKFEESFLPGDRRLQQIIKMSPAKIASDETIAKLKSFNEVFIVGFPVGTPNPKVSSGVIYQGDNGHLGTTAPITFGNSGSPVYDAKSYEVIGIAKYIYVKNGQQLNHIAGATPIDSLKNFLKTLK